MRIIVLALAFTPCVCIGQNASIAAGANSAQDASQIERLSLRVARAEFAASGVTDSSTTGLDPDLDASHKPVRPTRDDAHVRDLLMDLGARRFSTDSARPNSFHCRLNGLTRLVYLSAPSILGDSATVRILYLFEAPQSACHFFVEWKTFAFERRQGTWAYAGTRGAVVSS